MSGRRLSRKAFYFINTSEPTLFRNETDFFCFGRGTRSAGTRFGKQATGSEKLIVGVCPEVLLLTDGDSWCWICSASANFKDTIQHAESVLRHGSVLWNYSWRYLYNWKNLCGLSLLDSYIFALETSTIFKPISRIHNLTTTWWHGIYLVLLPRD